MSDLMKYKNYYGSVEYSAADRVFFGKIEFINDSISFESDNVDGLEAAFKEAVEDYLKTCKTLNKKPDKTFTGHFPGRIKPDLHQEAAFCAKQLKLSFTQFVEQAIAHEIEKRKLRYN